jgi:hypothetical protein
MLHIHHASQQPLSQIRWHIIIISISVILILGFLYFLLRPHFDKLRCTTPSLHNSACAASPQNPTLQHRTPKPRNRDAKQ